MEKHKYQGKTKEEAISQATIDLQEVEENLIIKELEVIKGGLFKSPKVEIEVIEKTLYETPKLRYTMTIFQKKTEETQYDHHQGNHYR